MIADGGCYCGQVRYSVDGKLLLKAQCHCRACQHFTGGAPNLFMLVPTQAFKWTAGEPTTFTRSDRESAVTRAFCCRCGTQLTSRRPGLDAVIVKIGTLDDPSLFGGPAMAIFTAEQQPFHLIPQGIPTFEGLPPARQAR